MSLSDCAKCWETPCRCPDGEIGKLKDRIAALEALLREAYGYTTAADSLLPERIRTALGRAMEVGNE